MFVVPQVEHYNNIKTVRVSQYFLKWLVLDVSTFVEVIGASEFAAFKHGKQDRVGEGDGRDIHSDAAVCGIPGIGESTAEHEYTLG